MTTTSAAIVGRALALLLLLLAVNELIVSVTDGLGLMHHWNTGVSGDIYWMRYYLLLFAGRVLAAFLMLFVASELRRGSPKLIAYLSGDSSPAK